MGSKSNRKPAGTQWNLEQAKTHFSEVVRRAQSDGPQHVTVRGQDVAVVIAAEQVEAHVAVEENDLVSFLQSLRLHEIDVERERDLGRDPKL